MHHPLLDAGWGGGRMEKKSLHLPHFTRQARTSQDRRGTVKVYIRVHHAGIHIITGDNLIIWLQPGIAPAPALDRQYSSELFPSSAAVTHPVCLSLLPGPPRLFFPFRGDDDGGGGNGAPARSPEMMVAFASYYVLIFVCCYMNVFYHYL